FWFLLTSDWVGGSLAGTLVRHAAKKACRSSIPLAKSLCKARDRRKVVISRNPMSLLRLLRRVRGGAARLPVRLSHIHDEHFWGYAPSRWSDHFDWVILSASNTVAGDSVGGAALSGLAPRLLLCGRPGTPRLPLVCGQ